MSGTSAGCTWAEIVTFLRDVSSEAHIDHAKRQNRDPKAARVSCELARVQLHADLTVCARLSQALGKRGLFRSWRSPDRLDSREHRIRSM
jgi:hypothetical protein